MREYTVVLTPDPEDGGFTVAVPALLDCITEGDTVEEALSMVPDAFELYIQSLAAHGEPVPDDVARPSFIKRVQVTI